ncbi:MAG: Holliday junction branch migration DNA helicase RuvB, partial [Methanopyri archaeon]|nr:Holliday junction branch migration DNA helicase RuvB [Methanopyri archaeon]
MDEEEHAFTWALRPTTLKEFIGQETVVRKLGIALTAARQRREPVEHILLYGPPGLGKTTLAHIIAHEMGSKIVATSGPALERPGDLMGILTNLERGDVLFIDEVHRLNPVVEEFLYPAMEDFSVDFIVDKGPFAKTIKVPLKPFTLVAATTRAGSLTAPLRERFGIYHHLDFYSSQELERIVDRSSDLLKVPVEPKGGAEIARRARGTPRIANRLLRRVRDYAQVEGDGIVTSDVAARALELLGVDSEGLDETDIRLLEAIIDKFGGGPVGVNNLAAV